MKKVVRGVANPRMEDGERTEQIWVSSIPGYGRMFSNGNSVILLKRCSQPTNWTELNCTNRPSYATVAPRVHWSRASASRLDWLSETRATGAVLQWECLQPPTETELNCSLVQFGGCEHSFYISRVLAAKCSESGYTDTAWRFPLFVLFLLLVITVRWCRL